MEISILVESLKTATNFKDKYQISQELEPLLPKLNSQQLFTYYVHGFNPKHELIFEKLQLYLKLLRTDQLVELLERVPEKDRSLFYPHLVPQYVGSLVKNLLLIN
jgi:hypothetical protein